MAKRTLTELPATVTITGGDIVHNRQGTTDKSVTISQIATYTMTQSSNSPTVVTVTGTTYAISDIARNYYILFSITSDCTITFPLTSGLGYEVVLKNNQSSTAKVLGLLNSETLLPGEEVTYFWDGTSFQKRKYYSELNLYVNSVTTLSKIDKITNVYCDSTSAFNVSLPTASSKYLGNIIKIYNTTGDNNITETVSSFVISPGCWLWFECNQTGTSTFNWNVINRKPQTYLVKTLSNDYVIPNNENVDLYLVNNLLKNINITLPQCIKSNLNKKTFIPMYNKGGVIITTYSGDTMGSGGRTMLRLDSINSRLVIFSINTTVWQVERYFNSQSSGKIRRTIWQGGVDLGYVQVAYNTRVSSFVLGETITGSTSTAYGVIVFQTIAGTSGVLYLKEVGNNGTFSAGETITGGSSGATALVTTATLNSPGVIEHDCFFQIRNINTRLYVESGTAGDYIDSEAYCGFIAASSLYYGWTRYDGTGVTNYYLIKLANDGYPYLTITGLGNAIQNTFDRHFEIISTFEYF